MLVNQVIKLKLLNLQSSDFDALIQVQLQYQKACQFVSQFVFDNQFELNSNKLSHLLYHQVRDKFNLKAQLTSSVFKTVTARYKTVQTQLRQKPFKYQDDTGEWCFIQKDLFWLQKPIVFNRPQADLVKNRDYSFVDNGSKLSIQTLENRLRCNFTTKGFDAIFNGDWKLGTAKLLCVKNNFYLHIAVSKDLPELNTSQEVQHVVGLDRGLRFLTTAYDEKGKTKFVNGQAILNKRQHFLKRRQALQSIGTKSAKRKLKELSGRENRWITDVNHQLSKTLVTRYGSETLFVLEDLTNVSFNRNDLPKQLRNSNASWSFFQFEEFLLYKSHLNHSDVVKVSAYYTSQRCVKCGVIDKMNRNHQTHEYYCKNCGYRCNDDRIAAMNLQELGKQFVSGVTNPHYEKLIIND